LLVALTVMPEIKRQIESVTAREDIDFKEKVRNISSLLIEQIELVKH